MASAPGSPWSYEELSAAVDAYYEMLELDLRGEPYVKARVREQYLAGPLEGRSSRSFEERMGNISAVRQQMGRPIITGYRPKPHVGAGRAAQLREIMEDREEPPTPAVDQRSDRERLSAFLTDLEIVLAEVVDLRFADLLIESSSEDVQLAWRDTRPLFESTRRQLVEVRPSLGPDRELEDVGLTGAPLRMKLSGFNRQLARLRKRYSRSRLRRVLEWANRIMGSLSKVIRSVEPIKEFKEAIEGLLTEQEDQKRRSSPRRRE
jgi:hypothetical protein